MEDAAAYGAASAASDCRNLVAPVAAWLARTGFQQVECGPAGAESATVEARWAGAGGHVFQLLLHATANEARCHFWSRTQGMAFTWMRVSCLAQVQQLLAKNDWFRQGQAAHACLRVQDALALPLPAYDERLAPYADVLRAAGFALDAARPYAYPGLAGVWDSPEGYAYHASLSVAGQRRPMLGSLAKVSPRGKLQWLFLCQQLDVPADWTRLLRQCTSLADAQARAALAAAERAEFSTLYPATS